MLKSKISIKNQSRQSFSSRNRKKNVQPQSTGPTEIEKTRGEVRLTSVSEKNRQKSSKITPRVINHPRNEYPHQKSPSSIVSPFKIVKNQNIKKSHPTIVKITQSKNQKMSKKHQKQSKSHSILLKTVKNHQNHV